MRRIVSYFRDYLKNFFVTVWAPVIISSNGYMSYTKKLSGSVTVKNRNNISQLIVPLFWVKETKIEKFNNWVMFFLP